jgi:hypothetical protein
MEQLRWENVAALANLAEPPGEILNAPPVRKKSH